MSFKNIFGLCLLAATLVACAGAKSAATVAATPTAPGGGDPLQYFVGAWRCFGGPPGAQPNKAIATYTLKNGVLREQLVVLPFPVPGAPPEPYELSVLTSYDSKNHQYVNVELDNHANWSVTYSKVRRMGIQTWTDHLTSSGKHGIGETSRVSDDVFVSVALPTTNRKSQPDFRSQCRRWKKAGGTGTLGNGTVGDEGTRTPDPLLAKQVLYQLSYIPRVH
jgi:hypothetical protein